jgi:hypothetical protein
VRVFPVPVIERLKVPMPQFTINHIQLHFSAFPGIQKLPVPVFPKLNIPSVIEIYRDQFPAKPAAVFLEREKFLDKVHPIQFSSFKSKLFARMEKTFTNQRVMKRIIETLKKLYQ